MPQGSNDLRMGHVLTWWNPASFTHRLSFCDALALCGFGDCQPEPRSDHMALRSALEEVFPARSHLIQRLANRKDLEVVQIVRGEEQNEYQHLWNVAINDERQVVLKPYDWGMANRVVSTFNTHLGLITADAVTQSLQAVLARLQGNRMRKKGSLYGLPEDRLPQWQQVAEAAERASARGTNTQVYFVRHDIDEHSLRAVRDAIEREIKDEAGRIRDEVQGGELGERALRTRRADCDSLREKVAVYEDLLKVSLSHLVDAVSKADEAAVSAEMLLSVGVS